MFCMDFLNRFNLTPGNVIKLIVLVVIALFVLAFAFQFLNTASRELGITQNTTGMSKSYPGIAPSYDMDDAVESEMSLSLRNIAPSPIPGDGYVPGADAEEFEITDYHATIETQNAMTSCGALKDLKAHEYVIFEHANEANDGCSYTFKVENEKVSSVLEVIEELNPRELTENTRTIKRVVEDYTSELEILQNKLISIETTLADAVAAYDDITAVAASTRDAESLAKIIDSKIQIIERLTERRIQVAAQIERIERSKAEQLDRLNFTQFYVNVYENKYIDGEAFVDSWKQAVREFVQNTNTVLQGVTIGFVGLLLYVFQFALYFLLLLFIVKFGWKITKSIWNK